MPALLLPEIFGARIRAKAVSLSLGVHWVRTHHSFLHVDGSEDYTTRMSILPNFVKLARCSLGLMRFRLRACNFNVLLSKHIG